MKKINMAPDSYLSDDFYKNTNWPIPVKYNNEVIGMMNSDGVVSVTNEKMYAQMIEDNFNNGPIGMSARSVGTVEGNVVKSANLTEVVAITTHEIQEPYEPYTKETIVTLPLNELGIVKKYNDKLWGSTYTVQIIYGGTFNQVGEIVDFLIRDVEKANISKLFE